MIRMQSKIPTRQEQVSPEYLQLLNRLDRLATWLDSQYRIPMTKTYVGWDAIIGLIPIAGDLITAVLSLRLISYARTLGADDRITAWMALNVLVDALLGAIPIVGVVGDIFFRANLRNLKLLLDEIEQRRRAIE